MAGPVDQRVLQALELVYAADTPVGQRREAEAVCQQLKEDAQGAAYGVELARGSNGYSAVARHFGLQLVEHALRYRWGSGKRGGKLTSDECAQLRYQVMELVLDACPQPDITGGRPRDPQFISEKLVAVLTMLIIRLWPSAEWQDLSTQLMHLYMLSPGHRELALRVWQTLGEELFVYDRDTVAAVRKTDLTNGIIGALLPRSVVAKLYPTGFRLTTDPAQPAGKGKVAAPILVEPGNEGGWIMRWLQDAAALAQQGAVTGEGETMLCALVDTTAAYLEWLPIKALVATELIPQLASLLGVRSSAVRQRVAAALVTASKRVAATGDDRDAVLLQFVQANGGSAVVAMAHAYSTTLHPAADAEWDDPSDALTMAQTLAQVCTNLVTVHWARPKLESNVVAQPEPFVELLMALVRDPRHTVSSLALADWALLIKHTALCRVPAVAQQFGTLSECATEALFRVCRSAHLLADSSSGAGIDEAEADQFDSTVELRLFLTTVARTRILGTVRAMCALDPAGFVQWIQPSLLPVFAQQQQAADAGRASVVVEAALMIVDTILSTLDDAEQRALEDGGDTLAQIQSARGPCYQLGQQVVRLASNDPQLVARQLQTLPSFAFLLRPAAMDRLPEARELLMAVLQRCAECLRFPLNAPNVRDLRQAARRATAALVRIALAIPDSLIMVYADLQQLIQDCLADPSVVGTVKSHLTEFQLTLIAGASRTLPERMELARPVLRPLIDELCAFRPLLETPTDFMVLLGLPALDQACVQGADAARSALDEARARRNNLTHVLSTLYICLNRTLGDSGAGDHGLALLWSDYVADVVPVLLLTIRSLHALWNAEHWQALPWQSAQAQAGLFGLLDMSAAERQAVAGITGQPDDSNADAAGSPLATDIRAMHHTLATLREHAYKCLGRLARSPDAFSAARVPDVAANFTGCLFADVQHMAARHWRVLLGDVAGPILAALGNWPGQDLDIADSVRTVGNFAGAWLEPLFAFCSQRLDAEWHDLCARGITAPPAGDAPANNGPMSVTDDMVHEKVVRDWTRAWAQQILSRLLASIGMWLPEAVQIEHELASSARVPAMPATAAATQPQPGNRALGAYILATPSALAATLSTCLSALKHSDTTAATRVLAQLSALAPSLLLVSLMPMYHPPTPAHASTVASYRTRMQRAPDLLPWLAGDLPAALVALLRDAGLTDLQDAALALLADLAYVSAAIQTRMPVHWPFRSSSGDADQRAAAGAAIPVGDPGLIYRQSLLRVLQDAGAAADEADQALAQIAISPAAESKRRRALLKIALQPLLALETSQLFSDPHAPRTPAPGRVGKHTAPAEWTNKLGGHSASVLDNDSQFDLGALMP